MPWRNAVALLNESHLVDFLHGGNAGANLGQTAFAQGDHALFASDALNFRSGPPIDDHFADTVGQIEQFADGRAAMMASARTFQAAGALGKRDVGPHGGIEASFL